jgi:hypothetical protein
MKVNFDKFKGALPYASELYGIYQPLLGWKSRLTTRRIEAGINSFRRRFIVELFPRFRPQVKVLPGTVDPREVQFSIGLAREGKAVSPLLSDATDSLVARRTLAAIEEAGIDKPNAWKKFTSPDSLSEMLEAIKEDIRNEYQNETVQLMQLARFDVREADQRQLLNNILARESIAAGALGFLHEHGDMQQMMALLMPGASIALSAERMVSILELLKLIDPRKSALASAVISPIGTVHLFRQYFFEFDTFLGPAVEHLWLSPGGTVELVEISTHKTIIERSTEMAFETAEKSEKSTTLEDELSDAVRRENASNTKFGVSLNTSTSFSLAVFTSQVSTGTTFDLEESQKESREQLHKGLRQQSEKIASELKRSFKSTFKTTTEVTDTRSRRYVIQNTTDKLVNYELRRKMRQVGVQVQDYGTHLCWQTYVDKPGDELGVAKLVHIAVPGDMQPKQHPELLKDPVPYKGDALKYSFVWPLSDDEDDPNIYKEFIVRRFNLFPQSGFILKDVEIVVVSEPKWGFRARLLTPQPVAPGSSELTATEVEIYHPPAIDGKRQPLTDEHPKFDLEITPVFIPSNWLKEKVRSENEQKIKEADQQREYEYKSKLFNAVKERVKLASNIQPRKFGDLREEERIIVYRNLIHQLMKDTGVENGEPRVHHIFAELIQSMFDVDKMLYFVAPEWWMPRTVHSQQSVFRPEINETEFNRYSTVAWGGAKSERQDNYYVTEDSTPAKLGSSLGWVIQLDGDNLRNAFLNAPWVKAVIPIREGKELQAIEWLSASHVEGSDGLEAAYQPRDQTELQRIRQTLGLSPTHPVTIRDAIRYLIARVQQKQAAARTKARNENNVELDYLPADKVYERGFDPLQGGFQAQSEKPFEVFDQWIEVVPTDQIVPVEVEYDPKTGMQK